MPRLMLFRHAKSAWPEGVADRDRPLAPRGLHAAPAMGAFIAVQDLLPQRVLVSPARRTVETWIEVSRHWAPMPWQGFEERIYHASADELLDLLREQDVGAADSLMLIGHNPGFEDLLALLVTPQERERLPRKYPTASLAVVDLPAAGWASVAPGTGTLVRFATPRALGLEED